MATDNLNYYSAWLPAGQQTDRYSSQPWCLRSKNLDIFSSSKSVKATAFSEPTQADSDVIKQDWKLVLKTDGKVYERENGVDTLINDPSINFPVHQVSYSWKNGAYETAQWGTVQDMSVVYEWDEWKSYTIFTDRTQLVYSSVAFTFDKEFYGSSWTKADWIFERWYKFTRSTIASVPAYFSIKITNPAFWIMPIKLYCVEPDTTDITISLSSLIVEYISDKYYYDAEMDTMISAWENASKSVPFTWTLQNGIIVNVPIAPSYDNSYVLVTLGINRSNRPGKTWNSWEGWELYVDMNWWPEENHRITTDWVESEWDYKEYYSYLPIRERKLVSIWNYAYSESFWIKWVSFQPVYKWTWSWVDDRGDKKVRYDFITDMWWETEPAMDVIGMMIWNEQVYMIGNMNWNGYIIPCDLTWWRWTPYIAYGCTFNGVTNIDYLMYLVWDDRGISQLWVYNWQELVPVIWWKQEVQYNDLVGVEEQYKFDWRIVNWRKNLILTTTDNRIFQYGQTYGGKGGSFIHELPGNATITWLKTSWNDLEISYSITEGQTTTNYSITYQDDTPIKDYNTEWEATYPIVIWNHLLEKEESDLYCSYILPSADCSLEFWASANHYHFWTFKTNWNFTPTVWSKWMIDGTDFNYHFEFVEKNWNYLTFKLVWDLPAMTGQETMTLTEFMTILDPHYISYTEFNHFRKIWEITTTEYKEWEFRFHNLNNKLELPNYTPELFALDLVANQRERW